MKNNIEKEIWKPIKGYENYEVSTLGRVKSIGNDKMRKEKILKPADDGRGYLFVVLYKNGNKKPCKIHRLVAETFIPNTDNLPCINHKDENKSNNSVCNLEFCTYKYNTHYSRTWEKAIPKANEVRRKQVLQFTKDWSFVKEYESLSEAFRQTGISIGNISSCCNGRYKSAGGFIWKYKS